MAQKDIQIASMEDKLQCLDKDLNESKQEASEKQANIDELMADLKRMKLVTSGISESQILEDNHMMYTQLVALAQALENGPHSEFET